MPTTTATAAAPPRPLLRLALTADAVVTGVNGAAYVVLAGPLGDLFGVEAALLRGIGAFLLAYAAVVALVAARPARAAVLAVVAGNAVWALDSLVAAAAGWGDPAAAGTVWMVLQALVVAGFAVAQYAGLRQAPR